MSDQGEIYTAITKARDVLAEALANAKNEIAQRVQNSPNPQVEADQILSAALAGSDVLDHMLVQKIYPHGMSDVPYPDDDAISELIKSPALADAFHAVSSILRDGFDAAEKEIDDIDLDDRDQVWSEAFDRSGIVNTVEQLYNSGNLRLG